MDLTGIRIPIDQPWSSISKFAPTPIPPLGAETCRDHICPTCGSKVRSCSQALAPQYLIDIKCPVCGYDFGRKGTRISILGRQPWSPISKFVPIYPREGELPMPIMAPKYDVGVREFITKPPPIDQPLSSISKYPTTRQIACPQCRSTLQIVPPSPEALVTQAFTWLSCPVCGYAKLTSVPTGGYLVEVVSVMIDPRDTLPSPELAKLPTVMPDWFIQQIYDALEQYEEKIIELEEALRTAQAAEFYNNPYGTIEAHAQTILNQFTRYQPTVEWPLELSTKWSELSNRLQKLIIDCRTAAKQRKPIPTYQQATGQQETQWITDTTRQLQQQGLAWSDVRFSYPQPGQTGINGRARLPSVGGISPLSELFTEVPVGFPDYSVEQRMQTVAEQEPWQLAEAVPPAPKKITPYLILAGLGVATAGVWYYKKKKKA